VLYNEDALLPGSEHPVTRRRITGERNLGYTTVKTYEVTVLYNVCSTAELFKTLQTSQI